MAKFFALALLFQQALFAQNADLLMQSATGAYRATAGAGAALATANTALAMNPAGLAHTPGVALACAGQARKYAYSLLRRNSNGTAFDLNWNETPLRFTHASIAFAASQRWGIGLGYFQTLDPYVDNNRRAITGSVLFHQATTGGVYAFALGAGFKLNTHFRLGTTLRHHRGVITSKIQGDNHGRDAEKHAQLQSTLRGFSVQSSIMYTVPQWRVAAYFATPTKLHVKTQRAVSPDGAYAIYFPPYEQMDYALPLVLGVSTAWTGHQRWTLMLDLETQRFRNSLLQLQLYEYGGAPNWKTITLVRLGGEFFPLASGKLPLCLGYAYLPQLYASNEAIGLQSSIFNYENTQQNRKHLFTAGTRLNVQRFTFALGVEYGQLKWHRNLQTTDAVRDDYREITLAGYCEMVYHLR